MPSVSHKPALSDRIQDYEGDGAMTSEKIGEELDRFRRRLGLVLVVVGIAVMAATLLIEIELSGRGRWLGTGRYGFPLGGTLFIMGWRQMKTGIPQ